MCRSAMRSPLSRLASTFQAPTNRLYAERDARLTRGERVIDLVSGNVTDQGIVFPPERLECCRAEGLAL